MSLKAKFNEKQIFFRLKDISGVFSLNKKSLFRQFLSGSFRFLICFQLIFVSYHSHSTTRINGNFSKKEINEDSNKRIVQKYNDEIESLRELIFSDKLGKAQKDHPLDLFSLLSQKVEKFQKIENGELKSAPAPYFRQVNPRKITLEIVNKSGEAVTQLDRFGERVFKSKENHSFRIVYKGTPLHTFQNQIKWIAFLNDYIVFLQPSRGSNKTALISFIDLNYFSSALGKTTLPLFKIPFVFTSDLKEIEQPTNLALYENGLKINSKNISHSEIVYFSKLQQMTFNTMVSLTDPETYLDIKPILKDIVHNYTHALEDDNKDLLETFDSEKSQSYEKMKDLFGKSLSFAKHRGSSKDVSGIFGNLKEAEKNLEEEAYREVVKNFTEHLKQDEAFQTALLSMSQNRELEQKALNRFLILFSRITSPKPLGSPTIRTALALIASSMNPRLNKNQPEENLKNRRDLLKRGMKDFTTNRNTKIGLPILAGLGLGLAHPELGPVLLQPLSSIGHWVSHVTDITSTSFKSLTTFATPSGLKDVYFSDGKFEKLMTGLGALFGIFFTSAGLIHFTTNSHHYAKNFTKSKSESIKKHFIEYVNQDKKQFIKDLASAELRKIGLSVDIVLSDGTVFKGLYRSTERWKHLLENFLHDPNINATFTSKSGDVLPLRLVPSKISEETKQDKIVIKINTPNASKMEREFVIEKGHLEDYFSKDQGVEESQSAETIESRVSNLYIQGSEFNMKEGEFLDAEFSKEEEAYIKRIVKQVEEEGKKSSSEESMSQKEITTLTKAFVHFFIGYSSWKKTFYVFGKIWNRFDLLRHFAIRPFTVATLLRHSNYYDLIYKKNHKPTSLNGGLGFSVLKTKNYISAIKDRKEKRRSVKESLQRLKDFEEKIIPIERKYLKAASEQALISLVKQSANDPKLSQIINGGIASDTPFLRQSRNKKHKLFFRIYQDELFYESMYDYLKEQTDYSGENFKKIKKISIEDLDKPIHFPEESMKQVRDRVKSIAEREKIEAKALNVTRDLRQFFKRRSAIHDINVEKALNPSNNMAMESYHIAEKGLGDSESMARASRSLMTRITVDKPIELAFLLLMLAGVEEGLLKILHDEKFGEESFFYLGRYTIWNIFFMMIVLDAFSGTWLKLQKDARLDSLGGFNIIPTKEEIQKKFAGTRWYWKQVFSKDNTFFENYKYSSRVLFAYLPTAMILHFGFNMATLGRFDIDALFAGYLFLVITGLESARFRFENAFEKSANFSLKKFIEKGVDFNKDHRKFLAHPLIQAFKTKELVKIRAKYNLKFAFLFDNPMGSLTETFANIDTPLGSRAFQRLFLGGHLVTEYIVDALDSLERAHLLPSSVTESCKTIFTKNRTDL